MEGCYIYCVLFLQDCAKMYSGKIKQKGQDLLSC